MTPERWQQVKQIFQSALERNPAERSAFLTEACAGDAALRGEVESLISSHKQAGDSIEAMADSIVHGATVAGARHVGIGTDFDGWVFSARGIRDATRYPALTEKLVQRGFSEEELWGILGGNYLRVLGEDYAS